MDTTGVTSADLGVMSGQCTRNRKNGCEKVAGGYKFLWKIVADISEIRGAVVCENWAEGSSRWDILGRSEKD